MSHTDFDSIVAIQRLIRSAAPVKIRQGLLTGSPIAAKQAVKCGEIFLEPCFYECQEASMSSHRTCLRSHTCGELRAEHAETQVTLLGWLDLKRTFGALNFITLRDRYGSTQVNLKLDALDMSDDEKKQIESIHGEDFLKIVGVVKKRPDDQINPDMPTGEVEVMATNIEILSRAETPPILVGTKADKEAAEGREADEELRLEYRYLDLRRPELQKRLILRHKICSSFRNTLDNLDFIDVETPILTLSTPEGARDYLVPSRVSAEHFYALPQSPQIFKQLLMISGFDRYYQIARCFRDEDLRSDRQPEFTQLDLEMACVEEEDILALLEKVVTNACKVAGFEIQTPFPRMDYHHAMLHYGSDKPDTRFELLIQDCTELMKQTADNFIKKTVLAGGVARVLGVPNGCADMTRKQLDGLSDIARERGGGGVAYMKVVGDKGADKRVQSSLAKFFSPEQIEELLEIAGATNNGDLVLLVADADRFKAANIIGDVRLHMGRKMGMLDGKESQLNFLFTVKFPLFEADPDNPGQVMPTAHPFTGVLPDDVEHLYTDPTKVRGRHYDLVLNGVELGSGSIRIHQSDVQSRIFEILGLSKEEQEERFGFLLKAFKYGAPPHGGFALGLDRFVQILTRGRSIRDIIAFPKTNNARCPMTQAPATVSETQLDDVHIRLKSSAKKD